MTEVQTTQWNQYACTSRSLVKLANMHNISISDDEFAVRFEQYFPDREKSYGYLDEYAFFKITNELGLPKTVGQSDDYSFVEQEFNAHKKPTLVMSHIDLNPEKTNVVKHCSVLVSIDPKRFTVWTPRSDGGHQQLDFAREDWTGKQCYAVAFL